jgi:hypothetical protein
MTFFSKLSISGKEMTDSQEALSLALSTLENDLELDPFGGMYISAERDGYEFGLLAVTERESGVFFIHETRKEKQFDAFLSLGNLEYIDEYVLTSDNNDYQCKALFVDKDRAMKVVEYFFISGGEKSDIIPWKRESDFPPDFIWGGNIDGFPEGVGPKRR